MIETEVSGDPIIVGTKDGRIYYSDNDVFELEESVIEGITLSEGGVSPIASRVELAVSPSNNDYIYALFGEVQDKIDEDGKYSRFHGLYRSTDGGRNFSLLSDSPNVLGHADGSEEKASCQADYDLALAVHPTEPDQVFVGAVNVWHYEVNSNTWSKMSDWTGNENFGYTHADIHSLTFAGGRLYCASDGGVFVNEDPLSSNDFEDISFDGGGTFDPDGTLSSGLDIAQVHRIAVASGGNQIGMSTWDNGVSLMNLDKGVDVKLSFLGGGDGGGVHFNQYGVWSMQHGYGDEIFLHDPLNLRKRIRFKIANFSGPSFIQTLHSEDGTDHTDIYLAANDIYKFWVKPDELNLAYEHDDMFLGVGADIISEGKIGEQATRDMAVDASATYMYVLKDEASYDTNEVYRGNLSNNEWSTVSSSPSELHLTRIAIDPENKDAFVVTCGGYKSGEKVFRVSYEEEETITWQWENISGLLPNVPVNCIVFDETVAKGMYIGTDLGVFYRDNYLDDWIPFDNALPYTMVTDLKIESGFVYAATYGRGVWRSPVYCQTNPIQICETGGTCALPKKENEEGNLGIDVYETSSSINSSAALSISSRAIYRASEISLNPGFQFIPETDEAFFSTDFSFDQCDAGHLGARKSGLNGISNSRGLSGTYAGAIGSKEFNQNHSQEEEGFDVRLYPNPFSTHANLEVNIKKDLEKVKVQLVDVQGKTVQDIYSSYLSYGIHKIQIETSNILPGLYNCIVTIGSEDHSIKVLIGMN